MTTRELYDKLWDIGCQTYVYDADNADFVLSDEDMEKLKKMKPTNCKKLQEWNQIQWRDDKLLQEGEQFRSKHITFQEFKRRMVFKRDGWCYVHKRIKQSS